jgi:hypothetical protein
MVRQRLKVKEKEIAKKQMTIRKTSAKETYIPGNDPIYYNLLKDNRHDDEIFSRVDKFFVNHYFYVGTEQLCEKIFYPSNHGSKEIENHDKDWGEHPLKALNDRLINEGIGLIGKRPEAEIYKPIKRVKLKAKPQRIKLNAKD